MAITKRVEAIADVPAPAIRLVPIVERMAEAIERLLDLSFGYDRHARTAYRLRAGIAAAPDLSSAALDDGGRLVGSLQSWPLALVDGAGVATPLWLVGPIAVAPDRRGQGIGRAMLAHACAAIDRTDRAAVLIGDPDYYAPYGFAATATARWTLPGPVERHRLLARARAGTALPAEGVLSAEVFGAGG